MAGKGLHLGVEDAGGRLDNADSLVVGLKGVESILAVPDNGGKVELEVLGVHLGLEAVGQAGAA